MKNKLDSLYCTTSTIEDNRRALRALVKEYGKIPARHALRRHATDLRMALCWSEYHSKQYIKLALMLRLVCSSYDKGNNILKYMNDIEDENEKK